MYLHMNLDGATSFIILWSKDSDTWNVRHSDTWLVQPEFNSCCQMVASNGTQLRNLGNCISTLIGHGACRPCPHACINNLWFSCTTWLANWWYVRIYNAAYI